MCFQNPVPEGVERRASRVERQSRASSGADGRFRNRRVGKLACQRVWFGSASPGSPGAALRLPLSCHFVWCMLTRSIPLVSPFGLPCGSLPSGRPAAWLWLIPLSAFLRESRTFCHSQECWSKSEGVEGPEPRVEGAGGQRFTIFDLLSSIFWRIAPRGAPPPIS
jgi:hypothetical protein